MSGYRLRALLEDPNFCQSLAYGTNNQIDGRNQHSQNYDGKSFLNPTDINSSKLNSDNGKKSKPADNSGYFQGSALLRNNVWANLGEGEDEFNLEYMDLDEFLSETGLVDANFNTHSASNTPPPQLQLNSSPSPSIEQLLQQGSVSSPSLSPQEHTLVSVQEATAQSFPPQSPTNCKEQEVVNSPKASTSASSSVESPTKPVTQSVTLTSSQVVKKRKYSEDGEGLTDTSVVVVPGQDGFNPAAVKFAPEELQPQPIIKKSKKQFVPNENKDDKYWKRRNKNNVAAKRSREARRAKENQIIMRAGYLESEVDRLTNEGAEKDREIERLKGVINQLQSVRS